MTENDERAANLDFVRFFNFHAFMFFINWQSRDSFDAIAKTVPEGDPHFPLIASIRTLCDFMDNRGLIPDDDLTIGEYLRQLIEPRLDDVCNLIDRVTVHLFESDLNADDWLEMSTEQKITILRAVNLEICPRFVAAENPLKVHVGQIIGHIDSYFLHAWEGTIPQARIREDWSPVSTPDAGPRDADKEP
jgi:hypothetical protein